MLTLPSVLRIVPILTAPDDAGFVLTGTASGDAGAHRGTGFEVRRYACEMYRPALSRSQTLVVRTRPRTVVPITEQRTVTRCWLCTVPTTRADSEGAERI